MTRALKRNVDLGHKGRFVLRNRRKQQIVVSRDSVSVNGRIARRDSELAQVLSQFERRLRFGIKVYVIPREKVTAVMITRTAANKWDAAMSRTDVTLDIADAGTAVFRSLAVLVTVKVPGARYDLAEMFRNLGYPVGRAAAAAA
jgi:hypothetical protein